MDKNYYISMKEVMENENTELPRPSVKIIYVPSGEDPVWHETLSCNGAVVGIVSNQHYIKRYEC